MKIDLNNPISFACDAIAESIIPDEHPDTIKFLSGVFHDILDHPCVDDELRQELVGQLAKSVNAEVIEKDDFEDIEDILANDEDD